MRILVKIAGRIILPARCCCEILAIFRGATAKKAGAQIIGGPQGGVRGEKIDCKAMETKKKRSYPHIQTPDSSSAAVVVLSLSVIAEQRMIMKRALSCCAALCLAHLLLDFRICSGQRRKLSPHIHDRKSGLLDTHKSPNDPSSCSVEDFHDTLAEHEIGEGLDADLVPMEYTIFNEDGSEEKGMTLVYTRPHISTYYNSSDASMYAKKPRYSGFAIKVYNLSPNTLQLWW